MVPQSNSLSWITEWINRFFRPPSSALANPEEFAQEQFLFRVRYFILIKAAVAAFLAILYFSSLPGRWAGYATLVVLADGLVLVPYALLVRRRPVFSTGAVLVTSALAVSIADYCAGVQNGTSGVFYATLIVAGAVVLLKPRPIAAITLAIITVYLTTIGLEMTHVIPIYFVIPNPAAVIGFNALCCIAVAGVCGVAAHIYQQLVNSQTQRSLLTALLEGFEEISQKPDLPALLNRIAARAVQAIPAVERAVLLVQEGPFMVVRGTAGYGDSDPQGLGFSFEQVLKYASGPLWERTDMPELITQEVPPAIAEKLFRLPTSKTTLLFSLVSKERLRGLLAVTNTQRRDAFDANARQILALFAHQAVVAIENTQLVAEVQLRLQESLALQKIGQEIAGLLQMHDLIPAIYRQILQVMEATSFILAVRDYESDSLMLLSPIDESRVLPDMAIEPRGILGWIINHRQSLRWGNVQEELADHPEISFQMIGGDQVIPRSLLAVPLQVGNQVIGAISVQSPRLDAYNENDERFLTALANDVAIAVQNARLYDEVEHKAQELQQKQSELQGLVAAVSQRLQPPVEALAGFARLLRERSTGSHTEEEAGYLLRIERNSRWISQLVQDMLFLARLEQLNEEKEPIALTTLARGVTTHLELEQMGTAVTIQEEMPVLYADPVLMWIFCRNLLQNGHGLLQNVASPRIELGCETRPDEYRFYVHTNDGGLAPDRLERIFELFFPAGDPGVEGAGLAIARRIGQRYGGRVWAESSADKGTVFYTAFPRELGQNPEGASHEGSGENPGR